MDLHEKTAEFKNRHPWEISRANNIVKLASHQSNNSCFLDVGCGDLYLVDILKDNFKQIIAVDSNFPDTQSDDPKVLKLKSIGSIQDESVDFISVMDVLEHVEDDRVFLAEVNKKLKKNGEVLVTVPAFNFLISDHDRFLNHQRRYTMKQLVNLIDSDSFVIEEKFYFFTTLFFVRIFQKLLSGLKLYKFSRNELSSWKYSRKHFFTFITRKILTVDFIINKLVSRLKLKLPGLSICILYKKK